MTSKTRFFPIIAVALTIIGFAIIYLIYYLSMQEANENGKKMNCKENIEQSFLGTIIEIKRYEYSEFMKNNFFALSIKTNDSLKKFIDYQFNLETNKNILYFAKKGQTILKVKGNKTFTIMDNYGIQKTYTIPYCN